MAGKRINELDAITTPDTTTVTMALDDPAADETQQQTIDAFMTTVHGLQLDGAFGTTANVIIDGLSTGITFTRSGTAGNPVTVVLAPKNLALGQLGGTLSFYGASQTAKLAVTGSTGGNVALQNLLALLATVGLITNSTT